MKHKRTRRARTKSKKYIKFNKGSQSLASMAGEPFASGGFGCVFKPPIKCSNQNIRYNENGISKLMLERHAKSELNEINKVLSYVKDIPNSNKYFMLDDITSCIPDNLTSNDKQNYNKMCYNLAERGYNENNINSKLNDLRIINIPYGGIDIDKFWSDWKKSKGSKKLINKAFADTNIALVDLLLNGIGPLNNNGYLHMDLKGQNILRNDNNGKIEVKIIDWGLSGAIPKKGIPSNIKNRVIQYNLPFSNILFATLTESWIKKDVQTLQSSNKLINGNDLGRTAAMKIVSYHQFYDIAENYGIGHMNFLQAVFNNIFGKPAGMNNEMSKVDENTFSAITAAVEYNAVVLDNYVDKNGKFEEDKYFKEVFSKNVDIWGFLMAYLPIIDTHSRPWKKNTLQNAITRIICEYCFSTKYAVTPIPIDKLAKELLSLNNIIGHKTTKSVKTRKIIMAKGKTKGTTKRITVIHKN